MNKIYSESEWGKAFHDRNPNVDGSIVAFSWAFGWAFGYPKTHGDQGTSIWGALFASALRQAISFFDSDFTGDCIKKCRRRVFQESALDHFPD